MIGDSGRARHLSRRSGVRSGIPTNIALPKFLTPPEIKLITELKTQYPDLTWEQVVEDIIISSMDRVDATRGS